MWAMCACVCVVVVEVGVWFFVFAHISFRFSVFLFRRSVHLIFDAWRVRCFFECARNFRMRCDMRGQALALYANVIRLKYICTLRSSWAHTQLAAKVFRCAAHMHKDSPRFKIRRCRKMTASRRRIKIGMFGGDKNGNGNSINRHTYQIMVWIVGNSLTNVYRCIQLCFAFHLIWLLILSSPSSNPSSALKPAEANKRKTRIRR